MGFVVWFLAAATLGCTLAFSYISRSVGGLATLDATLPLWTPDEAYARLSSLGEDGRHAYLNLNAVDMIYPFCYAPLLSLMISSQRGNAVVKFLAVISTVLAGFFDIVENLCVMVQTVAIVLPGCVF